VARGRRENKGSIRRARTKLNQHTSSNDPDPTTFREVTLVAESISQILPDFVIRIQSLGGESTSGLTAAIAQLLFASPEYSKACGGHSSGLLVRGLGDLSSSRERGFLVERSSPWLLAPGYRRNEVSCLDILQRNVSDPSLPRERRGHDLRHPAGRDEQPTVFHRVRLRGRLGDLLGERGPARRLLPGHPAHLRDSFRPIQQYLWSVLL
jgi:hypothetical protein